MTKSATNHKVKIRSQHTKHIKLLFENKIYFLRVEIDKINRDRTYLNTTNTRDDSPKLQGFLYEFFIHLITFINTALHTCSRVLTAVTYFTTMKIMLILASSTAIVSRHDNALIHAPVIHNSVPISMSQN
jgi:hypothetical protein